MSSRAVAGSSARCRHRGSASHGWVAAESRPVQTTCAVPATASTPPSSGCPASASPTPAGPPARRGGQPVVPALEGVRGQVDAAVRPGAGEGGAVDGDAPDVQPRHGGEQRLRFVGDAPYGGHEGQLVGLGEEAVLGHRGEHAGRTDLQERW